MTHLALLFLSLLPLASASGVTIEGAVVAARTAWERTEAAQVAGSLEHASFEIRAGQNPTTVEVWYQGVAEADVEADPYAERLELWRIVQRKVLPAVGPASATFQYDTTGALVFAHTTGTDISGVSWLDLTPVDELRVYFAEGRPVKLIHDHQGAEPPRREILLRQVETPEEQAAFAAGEALYAQGTALAGAVRALVVAP